MSYEIRKAMVYALMKEVAGDRPIIERPEGTVASGPCPHCQHRIDPSCFGFKERVTGQPLNGKQPEAGLVVCGGCRKPVIFYAPGKYEVIPREMLRRLPKVSRKFIEREQELLLNIHRKIN